MAKKHADIFPNSVSYFLHYQNYHLLNKDSNHPDDIKAHARDEPLTAALVFVFQKQMVACNQSMKFAFVLATHLHSAVAHLLQCLNHCSVWICSEHLLACTIWTTATCATMATSLQTVFPWFLIWLV